ncbi:MAG: glycosyltransferase family 39 protein [Elusimicrobiota bacterium]
MKHKIIIFFLLAILTIQSILSSKQKCAYYDEPFQIAAGLYHLKYGDYRIEIQNPPLLRMISAFPLLFTNVTVRKEERHTWTSFEKYAFGKEFLYKNNLDADTILLLARIQVLFLAILLGIIIFLWSSEIFHSTKAGIIALTFYCFSPNILAYSGIAGTDLGVAFFIVLSLFLFRKYLERPSIKNVIFTGIAVGLALSSKFTAVLLIPLFIFFASIKNPRTKNIFNVVIIFIISFIVILVVYRGSAGLFFEGIKNILGIVGQKGALTFLNGRYSSDGFATYYLIAFLIKSTIPVIILTIISVLAFKKIPASDFDKIYILVPVLIFFGAASYSKTQIGLRYILPIYPLLFIYFSGLIKTKSNYFLLSAFYFLIIWHIFSSIKTYPHYLSYFNEIIGGPKNGYKYLVDSNLDWGQDLKFLKKYLAGKNVNLVECYFGQGDTRYEGIKSQHILSQVSSGDVDYTKYDRTDLIAISATYFQGLYIGQVDVFNWLKNKSPDAFIGYSILVFDISFDEESHRRLGDIFLYGVKNPGAARKEYDKAEYIRKHKNG